LYVTVNKCLVYTMCWPTLWNGFYP